MTCATTPTLHHSGTKVEKDVSCLEATMIEPADCGPQQWALKRDSSRRGLTVSKLPLYIFYALAWIPHSVFLRSTATFACLVSVTVLLHCGGLVVTFMYIYGIVQNKMPFNTPLVLTYAATTPLFCQLVHSYLFLYKSWNKHKTLKLLLDLDKRASLFCWSAWHKTTIILLTSLPLAGLAVSFLLQTQLYMDDDQLPMLFPYIKDEEDRKTIKFCSVAYYMYQSTVLYGFPMFFGYICLEVNIILEDCVQKLTNIANVIETSFCKSDFEDFCQKLMRIVHLISDIDDCYSVNISWFITISVNTTMVWLYLAIVLKECQLSNVMFGQIAFDGLSVAILILLASNVHSTVGVIFTALKRQDKQHLSSIFTKTVQAFCLRRHTVWWFR